MGRIAEEGRHLYRAPRPGSAAYVSLNSTPSSTGNSHAVFAGYTDTDMGNSIKAWIHEHAQHMTMASASACAEDCLKVIRDARIEDVVLFSAYDGSVLEW